MIIITPTDTMRTTLVLLLLIALMADPADGFRRRRRSTGGRRRRRRRSTPTTRRPTPPPTYPSWGQLARPACTGLPAQAPINCSTLTQSECACECVDRAGTCPASVNLPCPMYNYNGRLCQCNLLSTTPIICSSSSTTRAAMFSTPILIALVVSALIGIFGVE